MAPPANNNRTGRRNVLPRRSTIDDNRCQYHSHRHPNSRGAFAPNSRSLHCFNLNKPKSNSGRKCYAGNNSRYLYHPTPAPHNTTTFLARARNNSGIAFDSPRDYAAISSAINPNPSSATSPAIYRNPSSVTSPAINPSSATSPAIYPNPSSANFPAIFPNPISATSPTIYPNPSSANFPDIYPNPSSATSPAIYPNPSFANFPAINPNPSYPSSPTSQAINPIPISATSTAINPNPSPHNSPESELYYGCTTPIFNDNYVPITPPEKRDYRWHLKEENTKMNFRLGFMEFSVEGVLHRLNRLEYIHNNYASRKINTNNEADEASSSEISIVN